MIYLSDGLVAGNCSDGSEDSCGEDAHGEHHKVEDEEPGVR